MIYYNHGKWLPTTVKLIASSPGNRNVFLFTVPLRLLLLLRSNKIKSMFVCLFVCFLSFLLHYQLYATGSGTPFFLFFSFRITFIINVYEIVYISFMVFGHGPWFRKFSFSLFFTPKANKTKCS